MERDELLQVLVEDAPNGVLAVDAAGTILVANHAIEEMFGYACDDLVGRPVEMLVPGHLRHGHEKLRNAFSIAPQVRRMGANRELLGQTKDGISFPVEIGISHSSLTGGAIFVVTVIDIRPRKTAVEQGQFLEKARERLDACQMLGLAAVVLRDDGSIVLANAALKEIAHRIKSIDGQIVFHDPKANSGFRQKLEHLRSDKVFRAPQWFAVGSANDRPPMICHLHAIRNSGEHDLYILTIKTIIKAENVSVELIQGLFGLAPAEARVAALVAIGMSPKDAASQLGISEGNLRTTLKHIYWKMGVSRQSELATMVATLAFLS